MKRHGLIIGALLMFVLAATAGANDSGKDVPVRLLLNEVQAGSMATEQYCTLIFANHRFHSEKANRKMGQDRDRKIYEGPMSDTDWNTLGEIIDSDAFRQLNVPRTVAPLIIEDAHTITISVARAQKFQNMEFLDNKSRKPYQSELNPLLKWWKSFRGNHGAESNAPPDSHCSLDNTHPVFSQ